jgi:hypothetical protein
MAPHPPTLYQYLAKDMGGYSTYSAMRWNTMHYFQDALDLKYDFQI